jgi:hypothetical protein
VHDQPAKRDKGGMKALQYSQQTQAVIDELAKIIRKKIPEYSFQELTIVDYTPAAEDVTGEKLNDHQWAQGKYPIQYEPYAQSGAVGVGVRQAGLQIWAESRPKPVFTKSWQPWNCQRNTDDPAVPAEDSAGDLTNKNCNCVRANFTPFEDEANNPRRSTETRQFTAPTGIATEGLRFRPLPLPATRNADVRLWNLPRPHQTVDCKVFQWHTQRSRPHQAQSQHSRQCQHTTLQLGYRT